MTALNKVWTCASRERLRVFAPRRDTELLYSVPLFLEGDSLISAGTASCDAEQNVCTSEPTRLSSAALLDLSQRSACKEGRAMIALRLALSAYRGQHMSIQHPAQGYQHRPVRIKGSLKIFERYPTG